MSENLDLEFIEIVVDERESALITKDANTDDSNKVRGWDKEFRIDNPQVAQQSQPVSRLQVADMEQKMAAFLGMVSQIFRRAEQETQKTAGMSLEEIELSVEIGAEGEVRLIGSGAKASGKGAIKLKFKRQQGT